MRDDSATSEVGLEGATTANITRRSGFAKTTIS
jgi:hypothetical protein